MVGGWTVVVLALVVLASGGCRDGGETSAKRKQEGPPRLTRDGPVCQPAARSAERVDYVQGRVRLPTGDAPRAEQTADGGGNASVPVFEYERGARGYEVRLVIEEEGEPIATVVTDANGQWCVQKPSEISFGQKLVAEVTWQDRRLRAPVVRARGTVVSVRSEATLRWVDQSAERRLTRAEWLNLEAVVSTETNLVTPVMMPSERSAEKIVEAMYEEVRASKRVSAIAAGEDATEQNDSAGIE